MTSFKMASDAQLAVQELLAKFPNLRTADLKKELGMVHGNTQTKYKVLAVDLDAVLAKMTDIPKARFVKMAKEAWDRKFPEGREPTHGKTDFQVFLGEVLGSLKKAHPQTSHGELMKMAGLMWKERKGDVEMPDEEEPALKKKGRKKHIEPLTGLEVTQPPKRTRRSRT
jgi:hypothetical protein